MDIKKILLISLIAVAIVASVSAVSAGLFDGLFGGEEHQDSVVELDEITFNTTNLTKFKETDKTDSGAGYSKQYKDENETDYVINLYNWENFDDEQFITEGIPAYKLVNDLDNRPKQTINDTVVYSYTFGANNTKYFSYVVNNKLHIIVDFWSPDPNESAKMASTVKFNK